MFGLHRLRTIPRRVIRHFINFLIDAPLCTLDMQHHWMEIAEKTTQLFNSGQICVDESDQAEDKL